MFRSLLFLIAGLGLLVRIASAEPPQADPEGSASPEASNILAKFRVARHGDLLVIPVFIGGEEQPFILDTGAMGNVLHASLAEKLAPLQRSHRKHPDGTPTMYALPAARLAGTELEVQGDAAKFNLAQLGRMSGYNIQGILGMGFLNGRVIEFDFDAGSVAFLKSVPKVKWQEVSLHRDSVGRPTVQIQIAPNVVKPFIIDTGMSAPGIGEITPQLFDALLNADRVKLTGPSPRVVTVDGAFIARKGEIDVFRLGDFEHHSLRITSGPTNAIGLRYLSRYKIVIDFGKDRVFFQPGQRFFASPVFDASGMVVSRIESKTLIDKVHPDGPAAAAGLRIGDVVKRVNGHAVDEDSLFSLRQALSRPESTVTLTIERSERDFDCQLPLKNWQASIRQP